MQLEKASIKLDKETLKFDRQKFKLEQKIASLEAEIIYIKEHQPPTLAKLMSDLAKRTKMADEYKRSSTHDGASDKTST